MQNLFQVIFSGLILSKRKCFTRKFPLWLDYNPNPSNLSPTKATAGQFEVNSTTLSVAPRSANQSGSTSRYPNDPSTYANILRWMYEETLAPQSNIAVRNHYDAYGSKYSPGPDIYSFYNHAAKAGQRLDRPMRAALVLRELEGLEYEEIASALKIPVGTVRSRLNTARAQFRQMWLSVEADDEAAS
jgi:hypothetical protein